MPPLDRPEELAEGELPLAAHDELDRPARSLGVGLRRQARIVAADHDPDVWQQRPDQADQPECGGALEGHDRQPHDLWLELPQEPLDCLAHPPLDQDQIGDCDAVVRLDVARE